MKLSQTHFDRQRHTGVGVERLQKTAKEVGAADLEVARLGVGNHCGRLAVILPPQQPKVVLRRALRGAVKEGTVLDEEKHKTPPSKKKKKTTMHHTNAKVRASLKPACAMTLRSWSVSLFIGCCMAVVTTWRRRKKKVI